MPGLPPMLVPVEEAAASYLGAAAFRAEYRRFVESDTIGDQVATLGKNYGIPMVFRQSERNVLHRITEAMLKKATGPSSTSLESKMEALRRWESAFNEKVR